MKLFFFLGVWYCRLMQKKTPGTKGSKDVQRKESQRSQRKITTKTVATITPTKTITVTKKVLLGIRRTIPK